LRASHRKSLVTGTLIAVVAIIGIGLVITQQQRLPVPERVAIPGLLWPPPEKQLADFTLTDQNGRPFGGTNLAGKWSLLFFGYSHCPDVCPQTLAIMSQLSPHLSASTSEDLQLVFVSVDQQRDTPEQLTAYLDYFPADIVGLSGDATELAKLTRQLGIAHSSQTPDGEGKYLVEHSSAILLVDPQMRLIGIFSAPHRAPDIAKRFQLIRAFVEEQP